MTPADGLRALAARLELERKLLALWWLLALVVLGYGIGTAMGARLPFVVAGLVAGLVLLRRETREQVSAQALAEHLDRAVPAFEESTTLLLAEPASLPAVARLQRQLVAERWREVPVGSMLPRRRFRRGLTVGLAAGLAGIVLAAAGREGPIVTTREGPARAAASGPALRGLELAVEPPGYTRLPRHLETGDELVAEEGARLEWRARVERGAAAVRLAFSTGDTLALAPQESGWIGRGVAGAPALVRVLIEDSAGVHAGEDRRFAVRPDRPPVVTLVRPTGRTEFAPGPVVPVEVEVLATDDYGIDATQLSLTLASGRGEAVKFERRTAPFTGRTRRADGNLLLTATLDLTALGLGPGDELYFHAEATDRRTPVAGRGRSETAFLVIADTSAPPTADFASLVLAAEPEYFRSQRQIIIDTEKLLRGRAGLARGSFNARSNEIGIDQGLLRLRYGQFLGEEFEEEAAPMDHGDAEAPADQPPDAPPDEGVAAPDPRTEIHRHDDPENATLLAQSVKTRLKAAVHAMWQAELHLRTHAPERALPFEYRALELLKSVQQESRVYVQRVGFEPPPIEVDRLRLTGKLDGVTDRTREHRLAARDSLAPVREALRAARQAARPAEASEAGEALVPLAVNEPRLLPVLHAFRRLADSLSAGRDCEPCRVDLERRLYPLLPAPEPRPVAPPARGSPLSDRYLGRLGEGARR
jgi:hypothetical protein